MSSKTRLERASQTAASRLRSGSACEERYRPGLIREEIENIPQSARIAHVELGVLAIGASDTAEFRSLNIKYLTPESATGANLAYLVCGAAALGTTVI